MNVQRPLPLILSLLSLMTAAIITPADAATITVTTTDDLALAQAIAAKSVPGCTLRDAITAANTNLPVGACPAGDPGLDIIAFMIAGPGPHTIQPLSPLPTVNDPALPTDEPAIIDGTTQPGSSCPDGLQIVLNGALAGSFADGLVLGDGNTVRGLVITGFDFSGIWIIGSGNRVECNYLGIGVDGATADGNFLGVEISPPEVGLPTDNVVGTDGDGSGDAGERNVISGNLTGVLIFDGDGNTVAGNFIGTDAAGTADVGNDIGVDVFGDGNTVGTDGDGSGDAAERNVISGNDVGAVGIDGDGNTVAGNFIGTDAAGGASLANGFGVVLGFAGEGCGECLTTPPGKSSAPSVGRQRARARTRDGRTPSRWALRSRTPAGRTPAGRTPDKQLPPEPLVLEVLVKENLIANNGIGIEVFGDDFVVFDFRSDPLDPDASSERNCVTGNGDGVVNSIIFFFIEDPVPAVTFIDNWWGDPDGPTVPMGPIDGDTVSPFVDFVPFLTEPPDTCSGRIVVDKVTVPAADPTSFPFSLSGGPSSLDQSFSLTDGDDPHDSGPVLSGNGYSATETVPTGWSLSAATCDDGSSPADIDLSPGETVTCTFTNARQGIEITKTPDAPQVFAGSTATFTIGLRNTGFTGLTNLAVNDPLTPSCDRGPGALPPLAAGEATSYTCETAPLFADLANQATVTADVPAGPPISASATAVVEVLDPAVAITKTPAAQQILAGETATFTITVTNVGDSGLTHVAVSDPLTPDCERDGVEGTPELPDLAPGQTVSYNCTTEPLGADLTNVATVTAVTRDGLSVNASASAFVDVIVPIEIVKSPSEQEILPGETATFTITLDNPGTVAKTNVVVSDPLTTACNNTLASLAAGATFSYTCTTGPLFGDLTNVATVTADTVAGPVTAQSTALVLVVDPPIAITKVPVAQVVDPGGVASFTITVSNPGTVALTAVSVSDPATPSCGGPLADIPAGGSASYPCSTGPVAADFTNVATVTATASGVTVSAAASAAVNVREPIVIVKAPAEQSVPFGTAATFTITLVNEGTDVKTGVAVSDPLTPDCERAAGELGDLAPNGGSVTYTCTTGALTADLLNEATVSAEGAEGTVTASDSALVDVLTDLLITKTPAEQALGAGVPATFTIEVTNGGSQVVTDVAVADPATPACESDLGSLDPGEAASYTCTTEPLFAGLINVATATGLVPEGLVTATATARVDVTDLLVITKEPPEQEVNAGGTAEFTITVSNPSDVVRTNVAVSDPLTSACDRAAGVLGDLAPGASVSYTCTTDPLFADLTNVATATAEGPAGTVSVFANAFVLVVDPVIGITKTPAAQLVSPGDPASFTITLTNPGPSSLSGLAVADPLTPDCARPPGALPDLPAGISTSYDCQTGPLAADFTNVATVTATSETSVTVSASASAFVNVLNPIEIVKGPLEQQVIEGTQATFTITVTNDGASEKTNVVVTDLLSPDCNRAVPDLAPGGGSFTYACQSPPLFADLVNTATVHADSEEGPVTASASAFAAVVPVAPVVAGVATEAGPLTVCDTVRTPVRRIRVTITGSERPYAGADDPASYLLVGAGPDADFATGACAGGAAGDDIPTEIVSLALTGVDPITVTVDLGLGSALDPGLYRLLVCDTISDATGNALDGDGDAAPGGDFVLPFFRADPFNLFANGHFDDCPVTLDPWVTMATGPNQIRPGVPATDDSESSPLSASAWIAHSSAEPSTLAQCVPVAGGLTHDLLARLRFQPPLGAVARFEETCEFFAGAACSGADLGPASIAAVLEDEGGAWIFTAHEIAAAAGAVSALCDFTVEAVGSDANFDVFLDGLFLGIAPSIFSDGFESGDVSAWSSSVP